MERKMFYEDGDYNEYIIPKKIKKYYDKGIEPTEEKQLSRLQYLDILEVLVGINFDIDKNINLGFKNNDYDFKGIGYFDKIKVAFFGEKYGPTKFAITYKEFRKLDIEEGILNLNEYLIDLIENQLSEQKNLLDELNESLLNKMFD